MTARDAGLIRPNSRSKRWCNASQHLAVGWTRLILAHIVGSRAATRGGVRDRGCAWDGAGHRPKCARQCVAGLSCWRLRSVGERLRGQNDPSRIKPRSRSAELCRRVWCGSIRGFIKSASAHGLGWAGIGSRDGPVSCWISQTIRRPGCRHRIASLYRQLLAYSADLSTDDLRAIWIAALIAGQALVVPRALSGPEEPLVIAAVLAVGPDPLPGRCSPEFLYGIASG
ncbi:hypothetical protein J2W46_006904 [Paraburkholderia strydomiana]|nr:hypothetical protein [Paraburkholderia strydomiana]